jgi:4'-phosphopantetheinyl transferase
MSELAINWPGSTGEPHLEPRAVHIWAAPLDLAAESIRDLESLLSPDELERAGKFRFPHLRNRYVVARGSLRVLLGRYLERDPAALEFNYSSRGKPDLNGQGMEPLHFNLAHSHDLALIAVTRAVPVGVDVERIRPMRDADRIVERFFSAREAEAFRNVPAAEQDAAFFSLWTRKEAWLKATGDGISESLSKFEVTFLPADEPRVLAIAGDTAAGAAWSLCALNPASGFVGALALQHCGVQPQCWCVKV